MIKLIPHNTTVTDSMHSPQLHDTNKKCDNTFTQFVLYTSILEPHFLFDFALYNNANISFYI